MKKKKVFISLVVLMAAMMCALGTAAAEAYACYTNNNSTMTFYYDDLRSSRLGKSFSLNTGSGFPEWYTDGTYIRVIYVVFDPSFADARPTTAYEWFCDMENLRSITGIYNLNTSEVTNMSAMFSRCKRLPSLDVSHFETSKVTSMGSMFKSCDALTNLDLSSFNTANVTSMYQMFRDCSNLQTIKVTARWTTAAVDVSGNMFLGCNSLVGGRGTAYDEDHIDAAYAHIDGGPDNPGYLTTAVEPYACYTPSNTTLTFYFDALRSTRTGSTFDLKRGQNMPDWAIDGTNADVTRVVFDSSFANARSESTYGWFYDMQRLAAIEGMDNLNTNEVTNMAWMFGYCRALTNIDLSNFNTANVKNAISMFSYCNSLTSLDLSSFNTAKMTLIGSMFSSCHSLQTIYVSEGWNTAAKVYSNGMFLNCFDLVGGQGTAYDADHIDGEYAHIDGGPSNPGYFTAKYTFTRGDVSGDGVVNTADVSALINVLLTAGSSTDGADANQDGLVNTSDVAALIKYLLSGSW